MNLTWDSGTAYDLFVSLHVLHNPDRFGLRRSWAAGVRSRLPGEERKFFEQVEPFLKVPLGWIYSLPGPKDGASALWALSQIPVEERLAALSLSHETPSETREILHEVAERGAWARKDLERLRAVQHEKGIHTRPKQNSLLLKWWACPPEFGELILRTLQAYHQVFFAEEEKRLWTQLNEALDKAKEKAEREDVPTLIEDLSQGVRFTSFPQVSELILAPSYWSTPFVIYSLISAESMLLLFGARPAGSSLIPGEEVPDQLLRGLKALADPTRLRILKYLGERPHNPAQLTRRLRLRAPTVIHHLTALRLAGLVQVTLQEGGERLYSARLEIVGAVYETLKSFLEDDTSGR
jgi:DNA-binding transcriptional ArsR family regulator